MQCFKKDRSKAGRTADNSTTYKMAPNFEITMYLAQATGSCIVTDSGLRWRELIAAAGRGIQGASPLVQLRASMERAKFVFPNDVQEIGVLAEHGIFRGYPSIMRKVFNYLSQLSARGPKPNFEASLNAEFKRVQASTVPAAKKSTAQLSEATDIVSLARWRHSRQHRQSAPLDVQLRAPPRQCTDGLVC